MLFINIKGLTDKGVVLQFIVRAAGDKLEVTVLPDAGPESKVIGLIPKTFTATAEELDGQFAEVMATYAGVNATLHDQLATLQKQADERNKEAIDAAAEAAATKTKAATNSSKGSKPSKPTLLTDTPPPSTDGGDGEPDPEGGPESCVTTGGDQDAQAFTL